MNTFQAVMYVIRYAITEMLSAMDNMFLGTDITYLDYIVWVSIALVIVGFIVNIVPKAGKGVGGHKNAG